VAGRQQLRGRWGKVVAIAVNNDVVVNDVLLTFWAYALCMQRSSGPLAHEQLDLNAT
jgi:hypothetical protein